MVAGDEPSSPSVRAVGGCDVGTPTNVVKKVTPLVMPSLLDGPEWVVAQASADETAGDAASAEARTSERRIACGRNAASTIGCIEGKELTPAQLDSVQQMAERLEGEASTIPQCCLKFYMYCSVTGKA